LSLGLLLLVLFALWIGIAEFLYVWLYGPWAPAAALPFLHDVLTTTRGWTLIVLGCLVGFVFASLALSISVIAFPLMIDRDVGLAPALVASVRFSRANLIPVALWGAMVAVALVVGSLPLFVGLAVVMPVLGHATWRLYRRAVARDPAHEVPIADPTGEALIETPGLKQLWTFLDLLDFFRKGRV
jgi:uncharacterized membrane protein